MRRILLMLPVVCLALACGGEDDDGVTQPPKKEEPAECTGGGLVGGGSCTTSGSKTLGVRCNAESECAANETCVNAGFGDGYCLKECATDTDCGSGSRCESTGGTNSAKACIKSCASDSECPGDTVCTEYNGTKYCGPNRRGGACYYSAQCYAPGFVCAATGGYLSDQVGVCTANCANNASICGKGTQCVGEQGAATKLCLRPCVDSGDCDDGHSCREGFCLQVSDPTPRPTGSACESSVQCEGDLTCATASSGWPAGYCTKSCSVETDCDSFSSCIVLTSTQNICMQKCWEPGIESTCRPGYICSQVTGEDYGVCVVRQ